MFRNCPPPNPSINSPAAAELAIAAVLPALPWALGFADNKAARNLCFGLTAITLVVAALTDWDGE